jgi:hypothetical protein
LRIRVWLPLGLGLLAVTVFVTPVGGFLSCHALGRCVYEGVPFRFTVVDAETGQPLPEVHALAEWVLEGFHGVNGPLMVQDAISGPDGGIAFPAWGPITGPPSGLRIRLDPAITLFKPGYRVLPIFNAYIVESVEKTQNLRVRKFAPEGETFKLQRFRGTGGEWLKELDRAAGLSFTGRASADQVDPFHLPLLNRKRRVLAELRSLPSQDREVHNLILSINREIESLEGHER